MPIVADGSDDVGSDDVGAILEEPVTLKAADVTLANALQLTLAPLHLTWTYHRECVFVTSEKREKELLVTRSYDVSDLPAFRDKNGKGVPDFDAIVDAITSGIEPMTWDLYTGGGSIIAL